MSASKTVKTVSVDKLPSIDVKWCPASGFVSQIYKTGIEFAFLSEKNEQCFQFVKESGFLQDWLFGLHNETPFSIYGITYSPKTSLAPATDRTKIIIANADDAKFANRIPNMLNFVNQIEKKLKLIRTRAFRAISPADRYSSGVFALESSARWMLSPPLISLYAMLIRIGCVHEIGTKYTDTFEALKNGKIKPYQRNDAAEITAAEKGINKILDSGYARIFFKDAKKNFPNTDVGTMHSYMGIVSFTTAAGHQPKHWHRQLDSKPAETAAA